MPSVMFVAISKSPREIGTQTLTRNEKREIRTQSLHRNRRKEEISIGWVKIGGK